MRFIVMFVIAVCVLFLNSSFVETECSAQPRRRCKTLFRKIFFVNSFPEAIVHLVQKALLTCKIKQKITPVVLQNFVATRPE